jgi:Family of unknown function (DUF5367)
MKSLCIAGFVIWLVATVALRLWGQWILRPGDLLAIGALLVVSAPAMFYLPRHLFRTYSIDPEDYAAGGIALAAPGMILDTISAIWFAGVFPNMRPEAAGLFGGWLLFCNVIALLSAVTAAGPFTRRVRLPLTTAGV